MALERGRIMKERYRIDRVLRTEEYCTLYHALDLDLNQDCFLQAVHQPKEGFAEQARILVSLSHPNLARPRAFFTDPDLGQFLVFDAIEGAGLSETLAQAGGPPPQHQALAWIAQLSDALEYLHTHQPPVPHAPPQLEDIQINPLGQAVLFVSAGSPDAAPSPKKDSEALAGISFALLSGNRSPSAPSGSLIKLNPTVTPEVAAVIERALQPETRDDFTSPGQFKAALLNAVAAREAVHLQSPPKTTRRRIPWGWAVVIAVLILFVSVELFFLLRGDNPFGIGSRAEPTAPLALVADSATPAPTHTPTPPPPTPSQTSTLTATYTPTPTNTPEPTATPLPTPIALTDSELDSNAFVYQQSSACRSDGIPCWDSVWGERVLTTLESLYVDPNWPNPQLVFWHHYNLEVHGTAITIRKADSRRWESLNSYDGTSGWHQQHLSLEEYKGEHVIIKFYSPIGVVYESNRYIYRSGRLVEIITKVVTKEDNQWTIQDIQIVPGITPEEQ
jgi:serine/threonine protein kinase